MNEQELDIIDSKWITMRLNCSCCGSHEFDSQGNCLYCGVLNEGLRLEKENLKNMLANYKYSGLTPYIINYYFKAYSINLPELDEFIKVNKINEKIEELKKNLIETLKEDKTLTPSESRCLTSLLQNNAYNSNEFPFNLIIKNILLGNKQILFETFEEIIILTVKQAMIAINDNQIPDYQPKCILEVNDEENLGETFMTDEVSLSSEVIKNIYNGEVHSLNIIFHELWHIKQQIAIYTGVVTNDIMTFIKEETIRTISNKKGYGKYYDANYNLISYEIDARINGYICYLRYLESIGLGMSKEYYERIDKEIKEELAKKENEIRDISSLNYDLNDNSITFNELFDTLIEDNPISLAISPQLNIEYTLEVGKVRRKTIEELVETLEKTTDENTQKYLLDLIEKAKKTSNIQR